MTHKAAKFLSTALLASTLALSCIGCSKAEPATDEPSADSSAPSAQDSGRAQADSEELRRTLNLPADSNLAEELMSGIDASQFSKAEIENASFAYPSAWGATKECKDILGVTVDGVSVSDPDTATSAYYAIGNIQNKDITAKQLIDTMANEVDGITVTEGTLLSGQQVVMAAYKAEEVDIEGDGKTEPATCYFFAADDSPSTLFYMALGDSTDAAATKIDSGNASDQAKRNMYDLVYGTLKVG